MRSINSRRDEPAVGCIFKVAARPCLLRIQFKRHIKVLSYNNVCAGNVTHQNFTTRIHERIITAAMLHIQTDVFILEEELDFNTRINTLILHQSAQSKPALIPPISYISHIAGEWKRILLQILYFLSPWKVKLWVPCRHFSNYRCFREEHLQPPDDNWRIKENLNRALVFHSIDKPVCFSI